MNGVVSPSPSPFPSPSLSISPSPSPSPSSPSPSPPSTSSSSSTLSLSLSPVRSSSFSFYNSSFHFPKIRIFLAPILSFPSDLFSSLVLSPILSHPPVEIGTLNLPTKVFNSLHNNHLIDVQYDENNNNIPNVSPHSFHKFPLKDWEREALETLNTKGKLPPSTPLSPSPTLFSSSLWPRHRIHFTFLPFHSSSLPSNDELSPFDRLHAVMVFIHVPTVLKYVISKSPSPSSPSSSDINTEVFSLIYSFYHQFISSLRPSSSSPSSSRYHPMLNFPLRTLCFLIDSHDELDYNFIKKFIQNKSENDKNEINKSKISIDEKEMGKGKRKENGMGGKDSEIINSKEFIVFGLKEREKEEKNPPILSDPNHSMPILPLSRYFSMYFNDFLSNLVMDFMKIAEEIPTLKHQSESFYILHSPYDSISSAYSSASSPSPTPLPFTVTRVGRYKKCQGDYVLLSGSFIDSEKIYRESITHLVKSIQQHCVQHQTQSASASALSFDPFNPSGIPISFHPDYVWLASALQGILHCLAKQFHYCQFQSNSSSLSHSPSPQPSPNSNSSSSSSSSSFSPLRTNPPLISIPIRIFSLSIDIISIYCKFPLHCLSLLVSAISYLKHLISFFTEILEVSIPRDSFIVFQSKVEEVNQLCHSLVEKAISSVEMDVRNDSSQVEFSLLLSQLHYFAGQKRKCSSLLFSASRHLSLKGMKNSLVVISILKRLCYDYHLHGVAHLLDMAEKEKRRQNNRNYNDNAHDDEVSSSHLHPWISDFRFFSGDFSHWKSSFVSCRVNYENDPSESMDLATMIHDEFESQISPSPSLSSPLSHDSFYGLLTTRLPLLSSLGVPSMLNGVTQRPLIMTPLTPSALTLLSKNNPVSSTDRTLLHTFYSHFLHPCSQVFFHSSPSFSSHSSSYSPASTLHLHSLYNLLISKRILKNTQWISIHIDILKHLIFHFHQLKDFHSLYTTAIFMLTTYGRDLSIPFQSQLMSFLSNVQITLPSSPFPSPLLNSVDFFGFPQFHQIVIHSNGNGNDNEIHDHHSIKFREKTLLSPKEEKKIPSQNDDDDDDDDGDVFLFNPLTSSSSSSSSSLSTKSSFSLSSSSALPTPKVFSPLLPLYETLFIDVIFSNPLSIPLEIQIELSVVPLHTMKSAEQKEENKKEIPFEFIKIQSQKVTKTLVGGIKNQRIPVGLTVSPTFPFSLSSFSLPSIRFECVVISLFHGRVISRSFHNSFGFVDIPPHLHSIVDPTHVGTFFTSIKDAGKGRGRGSNHYQHKEEHSHQSPVLPGGKEEHHVNVNFHCEEPWVDFHNITLIEEMPMIHITTLFPHSNNHHHNKHKDIPHPHPHRSPSLSPIPSLLFSRFCHISFLTNEFLSLRFSLFNTSDSVDIQDFSAKCRVIYKSNSNIPLGISTFNGTTMGIQRDHQSREKKKEKGSTCCLFSLSPSQCSPVIPSSIPHCSSSILSFPLAISEDIQSITVDFTYSPSVSSSYFRSFSSNIHMNPIGGLRITRCSLLPFDDPHVSSPVSNTFSLELELSNDSSYDLMIRMYSEWKKIPTPSFVVPHHSENQKYRFIVPKFPISDEFFSELLWIKLIERERKTNLHENQRLEEFGSERRKRERRMYNGNKTMREMISHHIQLEWRETLGLGETDGDHSNANDSGRNGQIFDIPIDIEDFMAMRREEYSIEFHLETKENPIPQGNSPSPFHSPSSTIKTKVSPSPIPFSITIQNHSPRTLSLSSIHISPSPSPLSSPSSSPCPFPSFPPSFIILGSSFHSVPKGDSLLKTQGKYHFEGKFFVISPMEMDFFVIAKGNCEGENLNCIDNILEEKRNDHPLDGNVSHASHLLQSLSLENTKFSSSSPSFAIDPSPSISSVQFSHHYRLQSDQ